MSLRELCEQYETSCERNYQPAFDADHPDVREAAVDELTAEAMAKVPSWIVYDYEFRGEDLYKVAREYVESETALVRERCLELANGS